MAPSRQALHRWSRGLSEERFRSALAALGAVLDYQSRQHEPHLRLKRDPLTLLRELAASGSPLGWSLRPLAGMPEAEWAPALKEAGIEPSQLADAWNSLRIGPGLTAPLRLAIDRTLAERSQDLWIVRELSGVAASAFFGLEAAPGRPRWSWPIRVGFLEPRLLETLYGGSHSEMQRDLTIPEVDPVRCDLLVLRDSPARAVATLETHSVGLSATCCLVLGPTSSSLGTLREATRVQQLLEASGVAFVSLGKPDALRQWFELLLIQMSHGEPGDVALVVATREAARGAITLYAAPDFPDVASLVFATDQLAEHLVAAGDEELLEVTPPMAATIGIGVGALGATTLGHHLRSASLRFLSERGTAHELAEIGHRMQPLLERLDLRESQQRWIRAQVFASDADRKSLLRSFRSGSMNFVDVSIGPRLVEFASANEPFPERLLEPRPNGHRLSVVLTSAQLQIEPMVAEIELPAVGPSTSARFGVPVPEELNRLELRVAVAYRNRILQTALLRGDVRSDGEGPGFDVAIESVIRPGLMDLSSRQHFGASLLLNHTSDGQAMATAISGQTAALIQLNTVADAVAELNRILGTDEASAGAFGRRLDSSEAVDLLRRLAFQGSTLYKLVGSVVDRILADKDRSRLQILSVNPNTVLPIEFVYSLTVPADDAILCPNARRAVLTGKCSGEHHEENALGQLKVVCPAGFWGVSKIIERQVTDPARLAQDGPPPADFSVWAEPTGARNTLGPVTPLVFAASDKADSVKRGEVARLAKWLGRRTAVVVNPIRSWLDWVASIQSLHPSLLLLVAHTVSDSGDGTALEIAASDRCRVAQLTPKFVRSTAVSEAPGPIVLLLGCDTAVPPRDLQSPAFQFRYLGAALVVGTISPVLGRHASRVAREIVGELLRVTSRLKPGRSIVFGEVLLQVRRRLLAKGITMAMCLAAYGDADWRFYGR